MQTIKFYTLGCKANQYDTQALREQFLAAGFREINHGQKADTCLINTCTVTQHADSDSLNYIRRSIRENPKAKVIVTGCLAELDSSRISAISRDIAIVKNRDKKKILKHFLAYSLKLTAYSYGISSFKNHTRAFLKIQDGCDNFCSYCKVPLVRGRSRSKSKAEIITEAQGLAKNGFKEIVLTGICLGAYGKDLRPRVNLVDIISELEKIEGLWRIRLSSIEAGDIGDSLINKLASAKKLCPHLHIPMQSGDNRILRLMNRKYTREFYLGLIRKIKRKIPGIAITTDVLVGFPGETEENFQNTLKLIRQIEPLKVHIFPYSARPGTAAYGLSGSIEARVVQARIGRLKKIAEICAFHYQKRFSGRKIPVLIEGKSKTHPGYWKGLTGNYLKVMLKSEINLKNRLIDAKLIYIDRNLIGSIIK